MNPVIIHLKLPDDLSAKAREMARGGDIKALILTALREQWMQPGAAYTTAEPVYPVIGSIPADRKQNAGA